MEFIFHTLDDLMRAVLTELSNRPFDVCATRGNSSEIIGSAIELTNPLARISRSETKGKAFSALGELMWYLAGDNSLKFIEYYIPQYRSESEDGKNGKIIHGAYGPRLLNLRNEKINQLKNIISLLKDRPTSRKAVIQLFDGRDLDRKHKEFPCTTTLQFFIRDKKLLMFVSMRSNDAFLGLPHDIFAFTMLQELVARTLGVDLGSYHHSVGSLHLYEKHLQLTTSYLKEGFQPTNIVMPPMPNENPWAAVKQLIKLEKKIRKDKPYTLGKQQNHYWLDLINLLQVFKYSKTQNIEEIKSIKKNMHNKIYNTYIDQRIK